MSISEELVKDALKSVKYPGFTRDIVSFGLVKSIQISGGDVKVQLALSTNDPNVPATIKADAEHALRTIEGLRTPKVLIDIHAPPGGAGTIHCRGWPSPYRRRHSRRRSSARPVFRPGSADAGRRRP